MGSGVAAGGGLTLRLAALLLVVANLGLPINDLAAYALLVAAALLILTGLPYAEPRRWLAAIALTAAVLVVHLIWPMPRIDEGHNVFLPGASAAQSLPPDVLKVLDAQFDQQYPPDKRCADTAKGCWRPDRTAEADGYAFSADGIFQHPALSRRVTGIDFTDPAHLRLGVSTSSPMDGPTIRATSCGSIATAARSRCSTATASPCRCSSFIDSREPSSAAGCAGRAPCCGNVVRASTTSVRRPPGAAISLPMMSASGSTASRSCRTCVSA